MERVSGVRKVHGKHCAKDICKGGRLWTLQERNIETGNRGDEEDDGVDADADEDGDGGDDEQVLL